MKNDEKIRKDKESKTGQNSAMQKKKKRGQKHE